MLRITGIVWSEDADRSHSVIPSMCTVEPSRHQKIALPGIDTSADECTCRVQAWHSVPILYRYSRRNV